MIFGLHHQLADLQNQRRGRQAVIDCATIPPHEKHAAEVKLKTLDAEILGLIGAILESGDMTHSIQGILNALHVSKFKSRHRSLVITNLEDAQSRILRELGDKPVI